ncbi:low temperature requirement protein A [Micromonospora thermarum]|uniref:Low temperature requirement protein A n=1 Tax=Micromonospora thermarum TaxID=2720024 RepID=A0ABX0Z8J7_9ACTN|nr:low temperature requirement protein A [Micromonospora thermarum]NJP34180.1 low temperature requirement protein A [Micromonospora thermarum]
MGFLGTASRSDGRGRAGGGTGARFALFAVSGPGGLKTGTVIEGGTGGRRTGRGRADREPPGQKVIKAGSTAGDNRRANFLELFFDLMLVFALSGVVSRVVQDVSADNLARRWFGLLYVLVLVLPMMWLWTTTSHITSRCDPRRPAVQVMVLLTAFGVVFMASSLPYAFFERGYAFAVPYVVLQMGRPLVLIRLVRDRKQRALYVRSAIWFTVSAVPWLAGVLVEDWARVGLWALAITIDLVAARFSWPVPGMRRQLDSAWEPTKTHHLADRYEQLLLIALGESVLSLGITYTDTPVSLATTLALVVGFATTVLLWRIYYYRAGQVLPEAVDLAGEQVRAGRNVGRAHVLMVLGIVLVAIGYEIVMTDPGGPVRPAWLVVTLGGPIVYVVGRMGLERVVFNRLSRRRLVGIAALAAAALPLAFTTPLITATGALTILIGMALADARAASGRPLEAPSPATGRR